MHRGPGFVGEALRGLRHERRLNRLCENELRFVGEALTWPSANMHAPRPIMSKMNPFAWGGPTVAFGLKEVGPLSQDYANGMGT